MNLSSSSSAAIKAHLKHVETAKRRFTLINVPGHSDFYREALKGAKMADRGVLVVAACDGEFDCGIAMGGGTNWQVQLACGFGIRRLVVAVNKMDSVAYNQQRYEQVVKSVDSLLRRYESARSVQFVPISAWLGDNLVTRSEKMPWYKGPPLLDLMDSLPVPRRKLGGPFCMSIYQG
jgi:translation elongation factor EF-1alpha